MLNEMIDLTHVMTNEINGAVDSIKSGNLTQFETEKVIQ